MRVLTICGSPRRGNSETIAKALKPIFKALGAENEVILLREHEIRRCTGCVEYCNAHYKCHHNDDMARIIKRIVDADGYVFVSPNYFAMPPGIFKDFMDKCSVLYTSKYFTGNPDLSKKKAMVIGLGTDKPFIKAFLPNVTKNFLKTLGIKTVAAEGFVSRSELKGNYNDILENTPGIQKKLKGMAARLVKSLEKKTLKYSKARNIGG